MLVKNPLILADGRWKGAHGIGRFSSEILSRLHNINIISAGPSPLSLQNFAWQPYQLYKYRKKYKLFFTPGFNPVVYSPIPFVFTIHDLIHLYAPGNGQLAKQIYYQFFMKPAARKAHKIITISNYSKQIILDWSGISESKIINVSCGISEHFIQAGKYHTPGYDYLLHVGSTKPHKNIARLIQAFALAKIDKQIKLIFTGTNTPEIAELIKKNNLENRIIFNTTLSETELPEYYRGALALVFPSLYEGFGLPVAEAMACGTPVLTANVTSLPEVAGDAAILINPYEIDAISQGIEQIIQNNDLRNSLIKKGLEQAKQFSWDKTARAVQEALLI